MDMDLRAVKAVLREALREEMAMGRFEIARKFEGGTLELKPADANLKSREIPVEVFFDKITSVREKLRVLEQKLNNCDALSHTERAEFQLYITRAYGSLTTFNILFADDDDKFVGQKGD